MRSYEKWFFEKADQILFVSPEDKKFAIEKWNINERKCTEVAFGVEISHYPDDKEQCKQQLKAKYNIRKISSRDTGTAMLSLFLAATKFSNAPP